MRAEPAIEAMELVKTYKGGVTALAGLSFSSMSPRPGSTPKRGPTPGGP